MAHRRIYMDGNVLFTVCSFCDHSKHWIIDTIPYFSDQHNHGCNCPVPFLQRLYKTHSDNFLRMSSISYLQNLHNHMQIMPFSIIYFPDFPFFILHDCPVYLPSSFFIIATCLRVIISALPELWSSYSVTIYPSKSEF